MACLVLAHHRLPERARPREHDVMIERCCPRECAYRVEVVEHYLAVLGAFSAARED